MSYASIRGMYRTMDDIEYIRDVTTRQEAPDKRAMQIRIEAARKAASVVGFPNTSEPAKERLATYEKQYCETYGLLEFIILFDWFTEV